MACRPVFVPTIDDDCLVKTHMVDFIWHPGYAVSQKQKSIESLPHSAVEQYRLNRLLEVSSKSVETMGVSLSAFNLSATIKRTDCCYPVENIFQSSKVFVNGGPFLSLRELSAKDAKKSPLLQQSGHLINFTLNRFDWPLEPKTMFYDWVYINALKQHQEFWKQLEQYEGFTDIEFNPKKSINCQAYSLALFCALRVRGILDEVTRSPQVFIDLVTQIPQNNAVEDQSVQPSLF